MFERNSWVVASVAVVLSLFMARTAECKKQYEIGFQEECEPSGSTFIERSSERYGGREFGYRGYGLRYQPDLRHTTSLIGRKVADSQGRLVGTIDDLAIDSDHGVAVFAVVAHQGIIGKGERLIPVPFRALQPSSDRDKLTLKAPAGILERALTIRENEFPRLGQREFTENIYRKFNIQPYWITGYQSPESDSGMQRERSGQEGWQRERSDQDEDRMMAPQDRSWSEEGSTRSWRQRRGPLSLRGMRTPGRIVRATDLLEEDAMDMSGKEIGEVHDLMVDVQSGSIGYVVLSTDLQGPDRLLAVPWHVVDVRQTNAGPVLAFNVSENLLANAPTFTEDNWPNMSTARWTARLHSYYGVQPTWTYFGYVGPAALGAVRSAMFDPKNIQKFSGTVESLYRNARFEGLTNMVRLQLNVREGAAATQPGMERRGAPQQMMEVFLAPAPFIEQQGIHLQPGDQVTIEGSVVQFAGRPVLISKTLIKEGKTVEFRSADGRPMWRQARMRGQSSGQFQEDQQQQKESKQWESSQEQQPGQENPSE